MIAVNSSRFHVLPMEKDPLGFSRALWTLTLPERRTATRTTLCFLFGGGESGGGGEDGYEASSRTRTWVMYDSSCIPSGSRLLKHASIMRCFSSSNRAARDWLLSCWCSACLPFCLG